MATIRSGMWKDNRNLKVNPNSAWFMLGDFNDIAKMDDQQGGSIHYLSRCLKHKQQIDDSNLIDLGPSGNRFTWRRNKLQVRLDRVYLNMVGRLTLPSAIVTNLPFRHSNHYLVLLRSDGMIYTTSNRLFRYKVAWETHPDFKDFVEK